MPVSQPPKLLARAQRHHDFFHGGVARALADPVHGALDLAGAGPDRGQRVRDRQAQVVVAVDREARQVRLRHALAQVGDELGVLERRGVADRIRDVQRARAGRDRAAADLDQELPVAAGGVLGGELDVLAVAARAAHGAHRLVEHLLLRHAQLVAHVDLARGDEDVDARVRGALQRLPGAVDVLVVGARQPADDRLAHRSDHGLHRSKSPSRRSGTGFDHVDMSSSWCAITSFSSRFMLQPATARRRAGRVEDQDALSGHRPGTLFVRPARAAPRISGSCVPSTSTGPESGTRCRAEQHHLVVGTRPRASAGSAPASVGAPPPRSSPP